MKKIFTLSFSILFISLSFASGEFFLKINNSGNYTVSINNQTITSSTNTFRFFDLNSGNQILKIYRNAYGGQQIFSRPIYIENNVRIVATIDRYAKLKIIEKIPFTRQNWYVDMLQNYFPSWNYPNQNPDCNIPWNGGGNGGWNNPYPNNTPYPNQYPPYGNTYPFGNYGYGNLINDNDLSALLSTMQNASFDDKKLEIAKTALKDRKIKTNQVHQLLQHFSFDQKKLDLAKYCYDKTIDQNNYYTLYSDFTFNSYSSELDKYINSK
ncbi:MAG: DUF4476 domain-containing protein [Chitinophagales bacterium]|nr:DUF4476 domain-containing protein [Bacteroidota bacterium]